MIVVTGGTQGIGRAIIEKFAANGYDICTCARSEADLEQLRLQVEAIHDAKLYYMPADLSMRDDMFAFVDYVQSLNRGVEVLVNNAGFFQPGLVHEEPEGALEKMMDTNLFSAYHVTRGLIADMKSRRVGHIFNVCSIASLIAYPNGGSYGITKFAMLGFSKALREEMKEHGLRVTSVMPGATYTRSWEGAGVPPERMSTPEDVAEIVYAAFKLSAQSVVEDIVIRPQLGDL